MSKKPEDVQELEVKEKMMNGFINHIKKHWWKWCLIFLSVGLAVSGFSYKDKKREIKKEGIKIPGISKAETSNEE